MNPKDYVKNVLVTEARDFAPLQDRFSQVRAIRLLHGAIGLASELAEIREMAQKKEIDEVNLKEEMGDLCWYMGIMVSELGLDPDSIFRIKDIMASVDHPDYRRDYLNEHVDGMTIDIGEMIDLLKKNLMYGKPLNVEGVKEKLFSLSCEIESALNIYGMNSAQARERNIEKLRARYGEKFTEAAALERNLEAERAILEKK
jgi:NTP pyrophosphatase (non-canonical NTP hydrolase)